MLQEYSIQISTPDQFIPIEDKISSTAHTWHGAGILWHESMNSSIHQLKNTHERFTSIKMSFPDMTILVISAYLPTSGRDDDFLDCIEELSNFIMENISEKDTILIGADFNCSKKSSSRRVLALQKFCNDHNLYKICCTGPTYHHFNGQSSSCIDFFLLSVGTSSKARISDITLQCTLEHPGNLSSHDPVIATLSLLCSMPENSKKEKYSHTYSDFQYSKVAWDDEKLAEYQSAAAKALSECEAYFSSAEYIPLKCQLYSELLVKCADLTMGTRSLPTSSKSPRYPPRLHQAWQHLRKCFRLWKQDNKPKDPLNSLLLKYRAARANFQAIRRHCRNLKTVKFNNLLMHTQYSDRRKHLKLIKKLRSSRKKQTLAELHTPAGVYYGGDTLEGFAKDAEILGQSAGEMKEYDNEFYRMCIQDNQCIFDFKGEDSIDIPNMTFKDLDDIITKEMKKDKACDIYKLTAEHLKYCGKKAKISILNLINDLIENIYYLSSPQAKAGLGTSVHKGKKKPLHQSSSYRRITVTPQIGSILDRFIDPKAEEIFRSSQSPDQYGFTRNISYLMGAVLRGECQRWAIDTKQTCYGVSFDGKAAFPSVDRDIQIRELYSCGETGDLLKYSRYTYENTVCRMKQDGKLSREIREFKGNRQGHKRAAGHFKAYINPCLVAANLSNLGFYIGPICISAICIADDTHVISGDPRNLQGLINIIGHYGKRYRLVFGADKTKITITGSKHDMEYFKRVSYWTLYGEKLEVAENNDHLGLIVSGIDEEAKNVDKNINSARNSLFGFLGNIFSYKCKISPAVQYQTWIVFVKPVLRSELAALPIRSAGIKSLTVFHKKVLRAILKLSQYSPVVPLYFMLGELPVEATLHLDILSLFWNIWNNPQTKVYEVVKYLLKMSDDKSLTWSAHLRTIFKLYQLADPLVLLDTSPWTKVRWKHHVQALVTSYHERVLRYKAATNSKLSFLNVQTLGLSGRLHPTIAWVQTTQDVEIVRPHVKMLTGDYQCYAYLGSDRGADQSCKLCTQPPCRPAPPEDLVHLLTQCRATADTRDRYLPDLLNLIAAHLPSNEILFHHPSPSLLTQFLLDCSSLNLPSDIRIPPKHPSFTFITRQCSVMIYGIHRDRCKQLKNIRP